MPGPDPLELPQPVLDEALSALVGEEGEVRERVLAELVAAHPHHRDALFALHATLGHANRVLSRTFPDGAPADPAHIDRYRVVRRLGDGAFGVVYLCEQDEPIHRQVAIKVLRPGAGDRTTLQRFAAERQLLAGFQHPAIANVIDAGELPGGRPWFAMEYVPGAPLTKYCDENRLGVDARLQLFLEVCHGVAHAHARDVVHRDLKPANVLIATVDGRPQPKIIDFGIAKAVRGTGDAAREATAAGRVVGTPGYMSPEQERGDSHQVDARSDVFSLGVMLFELLTGALPWPHGTSAATSEPPKPSTRLHGDPRRTTVATTRATVPGLLVQRLRGELDWIVLHALQPAPGRRYADARALADDLTAHLHDEPIRARPPSWRHVLARGARRQRSRILVVAAVAMIAALATVSMTLLAEARASESERITVIADAVDRLIQRANDPLLAEMPAADDLSGAALRDAASLLQRLEREASVEPELRATQAKVRNRLARLHRVYGQHREALALAHQAASEIDALLALPGAAPALRETRAVAALEIAFNLAELQRYEEALAASERALTLWDDWRRDHPDDHTADVATTWVVTGNSRRGLRQFERSLDAFGRGIDLLETRRRTHPGDKDLARNLVRVRCGIVDTHLYSADTAAAAAAARELLAIATASPGLSDEDRAVVHRRVAGALRANAEWEAAAPHWRECADRAEAASRLQPRRTYLADLVRVGATELAVYLYTRGENDDADREADRAMAFAEAARDQSPAWAQCYAYSAGKLGFCTMRSERFERFTTAVAWLERALATTAEDQQPPTPAQRSLCLIALGELRRDQRRPYSVAQWQETLALAREHYPRNAAFIAAELAWRQAETGDLAGARVSLAEAARLGTGSSPKYVRVAMDCELAAGDFDAALRVVEQAYATDQSLPIVFAAARGHLAATFAAERGRAVASGKAQEWRVAATMCWQNCLAAFEDEDHRLAPMLRELHLAQAKTALVLLGAPSGDPAAALAAALPVLDRLRDRAPLRAWHEELWIEGHGRAVRLALAAGARTAAEEALTAWVPQVRDAEPLLFGALLQLELAGAARQAGDAASAARADDAAFATVQRARGVAAAGTDLGGLLGAQRFAPLRQHARIAGLVSDPPR